MPALIRRYDDRGRPIITEKTGSLSLTYFNLIRLAHGEEYRGAVEGFETLYVLLSGTSDIEVDGKSFPGIGQRPNLCSGEADSVYSTSGATVWVHARQGGRRLR